MFCFFAFFDFEEFKSSRRLAGRGFSRVDGGGGRDGGVN